MLETLLLSSNTEVISNLPGEQSFNFSDFTGGSTTNVGTGDSITTSNITSVTDPIIGSTVASFNGTSSNLVFTASPIIGTGDYTMQAWCFIDAANKNRTMIVGSNLVNSPSGTSNASISMGCANGNYYFPSGWNNARHTTAEVITGRWFHIANMRKDGVVYCYIDGVQVLQYAFTSNVTRPNFRVGAYSGTSGGASLRVFYGSIASFALSREAVFPITGFTPRM